VKRARLGYELRHSSGASHGRRGEASLGVWCRMREGPTLCPAELHTSDSHRCDAPCSNPVLSKLEAPRRPVRDVAVTTPIHLSLFLRLLSHAIHAWPMALQRRPYRLTTAAHAQLPLSSCLHFTCLCAPYRSCSRPPKRGNTHASIACISEPCTRTADGAVGGTPAMGMLRTHSGFGRSGSGL